MNPGPVNKSGMKSSLGISVLIHAVLVTAVLLLGKAVISERDVFFVELKNITVSPPPKGEPDAPPAVRPKSPLPVKQIAKPEKKEIPTKAEESKEKMVRPAPAVEEEPAVVQDVPEPQASYVIETFSGGSTSEGDTYNVAYSATEGDADGDISQGITSGVQGAELSTGPEVSRDALLVQIRDAIQRELTYPPLARKRKLEGIVVAGFIIDQGGEPREIEIVESSGFSILDKEVVAIIQRAAPFPHITERVEVPVSFRLVSGR